jgi:hypothetical protein
VEAKPEERMLLRMLCGGKSRSAKQKRVLGVQQSEGEQGADDANSMTIATVFSTPPSPSNFKIQ